MMVQQALRDAGAGRDVAHRRAVEAVLGEGRQRALENDVTRVGLGEDGRELGHGGILG
jgi:hypothetical protein